MKHPNDDDLARYAAGDMPRDQGRKLEEHLVRCPECQRRVDELPPSGGRTVRWQAHRFAAARFPERPRADELAEGEDEETRRAARERGDRLLSAFGGVVGQLQVRRVEELLAEPQHRRRQLLRREGERFGGLNLCELLEERCRAAWRSDPAEAVELAKLAVLVAGEADPELYGSGPVANARELALLHLGVSFRIASLADGAEEVAEVPAGEVAAAFEEVRAAFLAKKMWFDVTQAAVDQMRLLRDLGRRDDMAEVSDRASAELREAGAPAQAEEPVRYVGHVYREGELDEGLFDRLDRTVQGYRNDPRMRFEPES